MGKIFMATRVGLFVFGVSTVVIAQTKEPRFPDLKREKMIDTQKRVYDEIAGSPRGGVRGPFGHLLCNPDLAGRRACSRPPWDESCALMQGAIFDSQSASRYDTNDFACLINAWKGENIWV
jgi:hypothetical protein